MAKQTKYDWVDWRIVELWACPCGYQFARRMRRHMMIAALMDMPAWVARV